MSDATLETPPLIGISTSEVRVAADKTPVEHSEPAQRELALGVHYFEAIERAGAMPVLLAPLASELVDTLLDRLDAVCLSGGPDLDPTLYGQEAHPELGPTEPELDRFELALAQRALAREMPVFAICRGMQLLNVATGGTLIQHLPDVAGDAIAHRQGVGGGTTTHDVTVTADSRLAAIAGATELPVNSFHHQAIDLLGDGLRITGRAHDGTVESVETTDSQLFCVGVQWHAESLTALPEQAALFRAFVGAAGERAGRPILTTV